MVGGLVSSIVASNKAGEAAKAANAEYQEKKNFLDNTFNQQYYSDITKRTDVQNMMRLLNENQEKQAKRDEALGAITGATAEAQLAAQDSRNKSYADALAEIASNASQLKDTYLQQYQQQRLGLTNPQASILNNQANMWSQAGSNLFSSGASLLGDADWSEWKGLGGGGKSKGGGKTTTEP